jgi:hypothetical protein
MNPLTGRCEFCGITEKQRREREAALLETRRGLELRDAELGLAVRRQQLQALREAHEQELAKRAELQLLALKSYDAKVEGAVKQAQAYSPHLVEALRRLGDERLLASLSENFGELAAVEGKGLLETAKKFLDFVPSSLVPTLKNGTAVLGGEDA